MAEYLRFDFGNGEIESTPANTTAYTFVPELNRYDHLYYMMDFERRIGAYIFKVIAGEKMFWDAVNHMVQNDYLCILNQPENMLTRGDQEAYNNVTARIAKREGREIPDTIGEINWNGEQ